jgi:8-oxo-dGTP pyrophosphatase MutT (NUDIX family)
MVRELHEETGYRCASIDLAMEGVVRLERENAQNYFFIGQGAERDPAFRAREQISAELITLASFKRLVIDGRFDHLVALPLFMFAAWKLGLDI